MKRPVTDVIRRGFENALANWPLLLFRFGEAVLFAILAVGSVIAIIVPVAVSAGLSKYSPANYSDLNDALLGFLHAYGTLLLYVFVLITVMGFVFIAVHSFVVGGMARILVDAERSAAPSGPRERFRRFNIDRWLEGGRETWWPIFWIYNIAYGVAALVVCIPIMLFSTIAIAAILREFPPVAVGAGCIGLPLVIFLAFATSILAAVWSQKAIVVCVEQRRGANDSLRVGWREARADMSRHFAVAFIMFVIAIGGSGVISMFSLMFSVPSMPHGGGPNAMIALVLLPARLIVTAISSLFSSAVALWSLASFAALSEKK